MSDPATLDSIRDALLAALATLGPHPGTRKVGTVARYSGTEDLAQLRAACEQDTALLLAFDTEDEVPGLSVETLVGDSQCVMRVTWRVYVCVQDARDDARAEDGGTDTPGAFEIATLVRAKLNGLWIEGLYDGSTVRTRALRKGPLDPNDGFHTYILRLTADYEAEVADGPDAGAVPFNGMDGDLDLDGDEALSTPMRVRFND